jgi:hypothetical protein
MSRLTNEATDRVLEDSSDRRLELCFSLLVLDIRGWMSYRIETTYNVVDVGRIDELERIMLCAPL